MADAIDLIQNLQDLKRFPEEVHLLCPRQNDLDNNTYEEDTIQDAVGEDEKPSMQRITRVAEAEERRAKFFSAVQLLAYDGDDASAYKDYIWTRLDHALGKCDICIREYYKGKLKKKEEYRDNYEDDQIESFFNIFDERDIKRITAGLDRAAEILRSIPERQRNIRDLDLPSLFAIFESLSCEAFLKDESLLRDHFDEPFKLLVKDKNRLKTKDYSPAVTRFLFDSNQTRCFWAMQIWSTKFNRPPTTAEFDWAIKEQLLASLKNASIGPPYDVNLVQRLWCGLKLIVNRLSKEQITHDLRAMDIDVCRLFLDHLQVPTTGLRFLLQTMEILLEKSPGDFWDAMQAISPTTIIEQIFNNPVYDKFMLEASTKEAFDTSALNDMLCWIEPFMSSLKKASLPPACRSLVFQLLDRLQSHRFSKHGRFHCYRTGLSVLANTLQRFTEDQSDKESVARVVLSDTLQVVGDHVELILEPPGFSITQANREQLWDLSLAIVRNSLALDCQSLKADHEALMHRRRLHHGPSTHNSEIWSAVVKQLREDNLSLPSAALRGIMALVGLETFLIKKNNQDESQDQKELNKDKAQFNTTFEHFTHLVCQILEGLAEFEPKSLDQLFCSQDTSSSLVSTLFSADLGTYQAAVDLIKSVSLQSGRKEAMSHLLQSFFATTIYGLSWSFRRISNMRTFASTPRLIKTGTDVLDLLCDAQTGILRNKSIADHRELVSVQRYWEYQWQALGTIFWQTEKWNMSALDQDAKKNYCRDTMQFAERLFDQYNVFANALSNANSNQSNSTGKDILQSPAMAVNGMVRWLRLKDEYLATTIVKLLSKLLYRLGELDIKVSSDALATIKNVAVTSTVRTILTPQEKAELVRTLEAYYKKPFDIKDGAAKKQSTLSGWMKPVDASTPSNISRRSSEDEFGGSDVPDEMLMDLSRSVELNKIRVASQKKPEARPSVPTKVVKSSTKSEQDILSFKEKRDKEREAKKKRDLAELARLKKNLPPRGVAEQTAGQGSGLNGIGVKGKDHTPADSMMVSSESESESDDELDRELFGETVRSKPDGFKAIEASKLQARKPVRGPVKKTKQVRSAKDMRARLSPDLTNLHKTLLSWDFFATDDFPPNSDRDDYSLVSNTFRDPIDYQRTFEPLLILEAWQGFRSSKEDSNFKPYEIKVANRLTVDSFVEVSTAMSIINAKELGLGEADIVLISRAKNPHLASESDQPHCLARISRISRKKGTSEISYRVNSGTPFISSLAAGTSIWGVRVSSLTPLEREYGALKALQYYDLCEEVVRAKPSPILNYSDKSLDPIISNYNVNAAQAKAVKSAIDNDAFTLIQGPPGSGKTKTIVALVGAILTNSFGDPGVAISRPVTVAAPRPVPRLTGSKKLLVCAPSNAAVDELVIRFKDGVKTLNGKTEKLNIVRLGRSDAINNKVVDVALDELVNAKLNLAVGKKSNDRDIHEIMMEHKATSEALIVARSKLDESRAKGTPTKPEDEREFDLLKRKKAQLSQAIDNARDSGNTAARDAELTRRRVQQEIIDGAHVICATLSGSGHEMFQSLSIEFETVIIDEAAQSIELSALIPLKYGCSKCILVGDPKQLPPTVLSREAARFQYEQSLFIRIQANHPKDVHLLDTQYRMHPEISRYPSSAFYDSKLKDGADMVKLRTRLWHQSPMLGPYRFFDVQGLHQSAPKGHSLVNIAELNVALQLYHRLTSDCKGYDFRNKIGIITPYKGQLKELKSRFAAQYGEEILKTVEFNTTDAFQGRESEIIIFSCVRASPRGIGFLADIRRMNVGLTRAKSSLWVLGNSQSLMQGEFWNGLIRDARERNLFTDGDVLGLLQRPLLTLDIGTQDVEMADALPSTSSSNSSRRPSEQSSGNSAGTSRRPSAAPSPILSQQGNPISRKSSTGTVSVHSTLSAPNGPSGGRFGLNDLGNCERCGSYEHFTHKCDNMEAKRASHLGCSRCKDLGHPARDCKAVRCLECGECGHLAQSCTSKRVLSKLDKDRITEQERQHAQQQHQNAERQKQRQLGAHDPTVPSIRVSRKTPPSDDESSGSGARTLSGRRPNGTTPPANAPTGPRQMPRMPPTGATDGVPKRKRGESPLPNAPKDPKSRKSEGPVVPDHELLSLSKDKSPQPAIDVEAEKPASIAPGPYTVRNIPRPGAPGSLGRPPPPMKKKKVVDPFIRPKKR